jgi:hypothetical protein
MNSSFPDWAIGDKIDPAIEAEICGDAMDGGYFHGMRQRRRPLFGTSGRRQHPLKNLANGPSICDY